MIKQERFNWRNHPPAQAFSTVAEFNLPIARGTELDQLATSLCAMIRFRGETDDGYRQRIREKLHRR